MPTFSGTQLEHRTRPWCIFNIFYLPKGRTNDNIIPEFKVKLNVIEVLIQVEPTEVTLTLL